VRGEGKNAEEDGKDALRVSLIQRAELQTRRGEKGAREGEKKKVPEGGNWLTATEIKKLPGKLGPASKERCGEGDKTRKKYWLKLDQEKEKNKRSTLKERGNRLRNYRHSSFVSIKSKGKG